MNKKCLTKNKKKIKAIPGNKLADGAFSKANLAGTLGSLVSGASGIITSSLQNAEVDTSEADTAIEAIEGFKPDKSSLDSLADSFNNMNTAKTDWTGSDFSVSTGEALGNMAKAGLSGLTSGASLGLWGAVAGGAAGLAISGGSWAAGAAKAKSKADEMNRKAQAANKIAYDKIVNTRDEILSNITNQTMQNIIADGGKIHIKPSKRGTFTSAAKSRGLGVQEFASKVLANLENYSEAMRKKAQFAKNASHWKHSYGGDLDLSGDYTNGIIFIDEGGTHEQNPYDGVRIGVDNQGVPNLVEEGEVIFNDYVFSNRLKPTKKLLKDGGFPDKYTDYTFAKIAEILQKESEDRPLDWISNNTLNDMMNRLITIQEGVRAEKNIKQTNKFRKGGYSTKGWTDEDSAAREEEDMASLWDAANQSMQKKVDAANRQIFGNPNMIALNKAFSNAYNNTSTSTNPDTEGSFNWNTLGRLAPTFLNAGLSIYNAAKKPDYSNADTIVKAYEDIPLAEYSPIGGEMVYTPIDKNPIVNKQMSASRAVAKDIQNNALNSNQALANLQNLGFNTINTVGDTLLKIANENAAEKLRINEYNKSIKQFDAQMKAQANQRNQYRASQIANAKANAAQMREAIDAQRANAISTPMSLATEDLGNFFGEQAQKQWILDNPAFAEFADKLLNSKKKCGGYLTKKK